MLNTPALFSLCVFFYSIIKIKNSIARTIAYGVTSIEIVIINEGNTYWINFTTANKKLNYQD